MKKKDKKQEKYLTWIGDDWDSFNSSAFFSIMVKTLSIPIETPTHGVCIPDVENIPTRLS